MNRENWEEILLRITSIGKRFSSTLRKLRFFYRTARRSHQTGAEQPSGTFGGAAISARRLGQDDHPEVGGRGAGGLQCRLAAHLREKGAQRALASGRQAASFHHLRAAHVRRQHRGPQQLQRPHVQVSNHPGRAVGRPWQRNGSRRERNGHTGAVDGT